MIRQAHTYLVSAMSGATLIAIAIVVFVLLVSAQVFRDFPLAGLTGGGDEQPHISDARAAAAPAVAPAKASPAAPVARRSTGSQAAGKDNAAAQPTASAGDLATTGAPASPGESVAGEGGGPSGANQGTEGAPASSPAASSPGSDASSSGGSSSSSGGGSGSSGGSGSGSGSASTPSAKVTETVNNTVNQVDETVTGGALEKTGVTGVTEGVVNGVVGPESVVGKAVDETVKTVGGLLGGKP
jgi:hypothetical protein